MYVSQGGKDEIAKTFIGIMENGISQLQRKDFLPTIGKGIGAFILAQIKYRSKNELIYRYVHNYIFIPAVKSISRIFKQNFSVKSISRIIFFTVPLISWSKKFWKKP